MRKKPLDGDTLYFISYWLFHPRSRAIMKKAVSQTFAQNWLEASHFVRVQHGQDIAPYCNIESVYYIERTFDGDKINHYHYQQRLSQDLYDEAV